MLHLHTEGQSGSAPRCSPDARLDAPRFKEAMRHLRVIFISSIFSSVAVFFYVILTRQIQSGSAAYSRRDIRSIESGLNSWVSANPDADTQLLRSVEKLVQEGALSHVLAGVAGDWCYDEKRHVLLRDVLFGRYERIWYEIQIDTHSDPARVIKVGERKDLIGP